MKDGSIKDVVSVFSKPLHPDQVWLERFGYRKVDDGQDLGCSSVDAELDSSSQYLQCRKSQDDRFIS
jgi:hypothetical protein